MSASQDRFTRTAETSALIEIFLDTKPGGLLTYGEIETALVKKMGIRCPLWRSRMSTVKRALRRDHGVVIKSEIGVGYEHRKDSDVVGGVDAHRKSIKRKSKLIVEELSLGVKDPDALSDVDKVKRSTQIANASTLYHFSATPNPAPLPSPRVQNSKLMAGNVADIATARRAKK